MSRTRVGIVGFGVMGARHARVFGALDSDFEIAGAFDPHPSKIPSFLRHFMRLEDLIDVSDLVVVSNPIEAHVPAATLALDRGRHVFVEKPLAGTTREAEMLVARARAAKRKLFVGHSERFHPAIRAVVEDLVIHNGQPVELAFRRIATGAPRDLSLETPQADAVLNLAVHDIDLAAFLGGRSPRLMQAAVHHDVAVLDISAPEWNAEIVAGRGAEADRRFWIETEDTRYEGDLRSSSLVIFDTLRSKSRAVELTSEEPLLAQAASVAAALRGESAHVASGEEGARAVAIAELALSKIARPLKTAENL